MWKVKLPNTWTLSIVFAWAVTAFGFPASDEKDPATSATQSNIQSPGSPMGAVLAAGLLHLEEALRRAMRRDETGKLLVWPTGQVSCPTSESAVQRLGPSCSDVFPSAHARQASCKTHRGVSKAPWAALPNSTQDVDQQANACKLSKHTATAAGETDECVAPPITRRGAVDVADVIGGAGDVLDTQ